MAKTSTVQVTDSSWQGLYRIAGVAAILIVVVALTDIVLSSMQGAAVGPATLSAEGWFARFETGWFLRMCDLGFWNIVTGALMIPVVLALFGAHRRVSPAYMALAAAIYLVGIAIYASNNVAIPMALLSSKYAAASEAQRSALSAAGEAMLARGEDFTPGSLVGFLYTETAGLIISVVMLRSRVFGRTNAYAGIVAFALLMIFTLWATATSTMGTFALIVAMVGGVASVVWYVLMARRLFQLSRGSEPGAIGRS